MSKREEWPVHDVRAFKMIAFIVASCGVWAVINWMAGVSRGPWMYRDAGLAVVVTAAAWKLWRSL